LRLEANGVLSLVRVKKVRLDLDDGQTVSMVNHQGQAGPGGDKIRSAEKGIYVKFEG
jgi:hypothetical protein